MLEKIYPEGHKVAAFCPHKKSIYVGQVLEFKPVEFARGLFYMYKIQVGPDEVIDFHYYQVFENSDWDGEKLKMHDTFHFELDAKQFGIDPAVAIDSIVEKLNSLVDDTE